MGLQETEAPPWVGRLFPSYHRSHQGWTGKTGDSWGGSTVLLWSNRAFALGHLSHLVTISVFLRDPASTKRRSGISGLLAHSMDHIFAHFSNIPGTLWLLVPRCLSAAGDICNTLWWNAGQGTSRERGSEANCF